MNYIEEAIKKAIEGGWTIHPTLTSGWLAEGLRCPNGVQRLAYLDPSFWQSLGKALGWTVHKGRPEWLWQWHQLIECLAAGKDPEEYFKEILQ